MSFPGVSRHLRISEVCWRTASSASSSRRACSSGMTGEDMMKLLQRGTGLDEELTGKASHAGIDG